MARVYRIVGDNGVYIGSTNKTLNRRLSVHKNESNTCVSKQLINPKIELIEECTEEDRYIREQYWIDNTECVNHNKAHTGLPKSEYDKQYRQNNKEAVNEIKRRWKENNKEVVYAKQECECGGKYLHNNKHRHLKTMKHINYIRKIVPNSKNSGGDF